MGLQHYISQKYYIRKRSWKTKHKEIGYEEKKKKAICRNDFKRCLDSVARGSNCSRLHSTESWGLFLQNSIIMEP